MKPKENIFFTWTSAVVFLITLIILITIYAIDIQFTDQKTDWSPDYTFGEYDLEYYTADHDVLYIWVDEMLIRSESSAHDVKFYDKKLFKDYIKELSFGLNVINPYINTVSNLQHLVVVNDMDMPDEPCLELWVHDQQIATICETNNSGIYEHIEYWKY